MQQPFEHRTYAPKPIRKTFHRQKTAPIESKSEKTLSELKNANMKTSFLLNDNSTLGGSEITFSDFESELEQENILNEITSIINDNNITNEVKFHRKITIERPGNPFVKNFEDEK